MEIIKCKLADQSGYFSQSNGIIMRTYFYGQVREWAHKLAAQVLITES